MSIRRVVVALSLVAIGATGIGLGVSANANPPCDQAAAACQVYDHEKATTLTFLTAANAACYQNVPGATGCAQEGTVGGTAYTFVFFPYAVCYDVQGTKGCIGPL